MKGHSYIGWISLVVGVVNFGLCFFVGYEIEWESGTLTVLVLAAVSLITGLIARFGPAKDNFGVGGIGFGIIAPIVCLIV